MKYFLIGFMGTGKTYWGEKISTELNLRFIDLDNVIEEKEQQTITAIFETKGEEFFRELEKKYLTDIVSSQDNFVMACGGGTPCYFNNMQYLKENGITIWLNCSVDTLITRLQNEIAQRPLIKNYKSEQELRAYILKKYSVRKIFYQQAEIHINTDEENPEEVILKIQHEV